MPCDKTQCQCPAGCECCKDNCTCGPNKHVCTGESGPGCGKTKECRCPPGCECCKDNCTCNEKQHVCATTAGAPTEGPRAGQCCDASGVCH